MSPETLGERIGRLARWAVYRIHAWDVAFVATACYVFGMLEQWRVPYGPYAFGAFVGVSLFSFDVVRRAERYRQLSRALREELDRELDRTRYSVTFESAEDMLRCSRALGAVGYDLARIDDGAPPDGRLAAEMLDRAAKDGLS